MELLERFLDSVKEMFGKRILFFLLIIAIFIMVINTEDIRKTIQIPRFKFSSVGSKDVIMSDIKLNGGSIVVTPLVFVKYGNKIIITVDLQHYYNKNFTVLTEVSEEMGYILEVGDEQREKVESLVENMKELLVESFKDEKNSFEVDIVYLGEVTWQKENTNSEKLRYWFFSDKLERMITKKEALLWGADMTFDLDNYQVEGFIYNCDQLMEIVGVCTSVAEELDNNK